MMIEAEALPPEGRTSREIHRHIGDFTLFWAGVYPEALPRLQATDSPRSVAGWGSVLQALAVSPATWADQFDDRRIIITKEPTGAYTTAITDQAIK